MVMNIVRRVMTVAVIAAVAAAVAGAVPAGASVDKPSVESAGVMAPTAWYMIQFRHSHKCLTAPSYTIGDQLIQQNCNAAEPSQWWGLEWIPDGSGYATFVNERTRYCINVLNSTANNAPVVQYPCIGATHEEWKGSPLSSGGYHFKNRESGKCMVVQNARLDHNAPVIQYTCTAGDLTNDEIIYIGG